MRKKQELSSKTLAFLEEEMRIYPKVAYLKAIAEQTGNQKSVSYYENLERDIKEVFNELPDDLQAIVTECFWGKNRHLNWETIGEIYLGFERRKAYEVRYQILEELALKKGMLIR